LVIRYLLKAASKKLILIFYFSILDPATNPHPDVIGTTDVQAHIKFLT